MPSSKTSLLRRLLTATANAVLWVVICSRPGVGSDATTALSAAIDAELSSAWVASGVSPAAGISDQAFLRRVSLDLAGRIPTIAERAEFLSDQGDDRRQRLIERLLHSDDHASHMADLFDVLLMGRGSQKQMLKRNEHGWRQWLKTQFRLNRPWNEMTEAMLLARPATPTDDAATWFLYERNNDHQKIAEAVAPAFFGFRIECAQCHDSMTAAEVEQAHYWGLVAFFNRGKNEMTASGPRIVESAIGGFSEFADIEGTSSPNLLSFLDTETVAEERPPADAQQEEDDALYQAASREGEPRQPIFSRRARFVEEVLRDHPRLAQAMVNRLWALLMGRGLVHPFDEIDSAHTISHPELLTLLTEDFRNHGYDIRRTLRGIANSDAYQRSPRKPDGVEDPATFAWYLERPLTAEQYSRSLHLALQGPGEVSEKLTNVVRQAMPDVLPDETVTGITEPLFLSNAPEFQDMLGEATTGDHPLAAMAALPSARAATEALFLATLSRLPDDEEAEAVSAFLRPEGSPDTPIDKQRLALTAWALVTSAEFRFNH